MGKTITSPTGYVLQAEKGVFGLCQWIYQGENERDITETKNYHFLKLFT